LIEIAFNLLILREESDGVAFGGESEKSKPATEQTSRDVRSGKAMLRNHYRIDSHPMSEPVCCSVSVKLCLGRALLLRWQYTASTMTETFENRET
jgi:hypothetical protein